MYYAVEVQQIRHHGPECVVEISGREWSESVHFYFIPIIFPYYFQFYLIHCNLGITFGENLSFEQHISAVSK